ncbi:dihydropteroate synthase [Oleiphilus messinensis]|uniref:dihydropteroate synthase n=2 Tax=Oleiphilus messinensis TaxID=141451 RepID=A0A1Y0I5T2_9GAMM|nr:dihydropteroate synthase [Oleiphilus messinensis]
MGVLNVTPDSFSDGGRFTQGDVALKQAERMVSEGASIIDIGGESTRPGAKPVSVQEEVDRVMPIVERVNGELDVAISVDTSSPELMALAISAGVDLINDVRALTSSGAIESVLSADVSVCLMHMQGTPGTMQSNPDYDSVTGEVFRFLEARTQACIEAGIERARIILDPGFGFGKKLEHNLSLLANLGDLSALNQPILIGVSRKSMFGDLLGRPVDERLIGSVVAAALAVERGASIIRVHDVGETLDALKVVTAVRNVGNGK